MLRIVAESAFAPLRAPALFRIVFRPIPPPRAASMTEITLPSIKAWARCCPAKLPDTAGVVVLDGQCERILVRQGYVSLRQNNPNPARGSTVITFQLRPRDDRRALQVALSLYDMNGVLKQCAWEGLLAPGEHAIPLDVRELQPGVYLLRSA
jgi:hypothetical protein